MKKIIFSLVITSFSVNASLQNDIIKKCEFRGELSAEILSAFINKVSDEEGKKLMIKGDSDPIYSQYIWSKAFDKAIDIYNSKTKKRDISSWGNKNKIDCLEKFTFNIDVIFNKNKQ